MIACTMSSRIGRMRLMHSSCLRNLRRRSVLISKHSGFALPVPRCSIESEMSVRKANVAAFSRRLPCSSMGNRWSAAPSSRRTGHSSSVTRCKRNNIAMKPFVIFFMRLLEGGVFIYSGWEKLMVPVENFMAVIDQYRFLSESLARPVSRVVPWLELVFGTFLLLVFMTRVSAAVLTGLLGVFVALLGRAIVLGLSIADCGCFGSGIKLTPHHALLLDTALVLCSAFVFRHAPRVLSLDRRLTACVVAMLLVLTGCVTARTVPEGIGPEI